MQRTEGPRRGFATRAIHAGEQPDTITRAHTTPIYQTATFSFDPAEEKPAAMEQALAWQGGFFYSRTGNPTTAALEAKLADLEGAEDAVVGASGMAAVATKSTEKARIIRQEPLEQTIIKRRRRAIENAWRGAFRRARTWWRTLGQPRHGLRAGRVPQQSQSQPPFTPPWAGSPR